MWISIEMQRFLHKCNMDVLLAHEIGKFSLLPLDTFNIYLENVKAALFIRLFILLVRFFMISVLLEASTLPDIHVARARVSTSS